MHSVWTRKPQYNTTKRYWRDTRSDAKLSSLLYGDFFLFQTENNNRILWFILDSAIQLFCIAYNCTIQVLCTVHTLTGVHGFHIEKKNMFQWLETEKMDTFRIGNYALLYKFHTVGRGSFMLGVDAYLKRKKFHERYLISNLNASEHWWCFKTKWNQMHIDPNDQLAVGHNYIRIGYSHFDSVSVCFPMKYLFGSPTKNYYDRTWQAEWWMIR